jgi:hypothetical protein
VTRLFAPSWRELLYILLFYPVCSGCFIELGQLNNIMKIRKARKKINLDQVLGADGEIGFF